MQRSVVSAFDPDAGDGGPVALGRLAAEILAARLLVVVARPGGTVPERLARLEHAGDRAGVVARMRATLPARGTEVRELVAPSAAAAIHAVLAAERPLLAVLGSPRDAAHGTVRLGSTTQRLVDGAPCAVAIVPREHAPRSLGRLAVAVLPSPEGRAALRAAASFAAAASAMLHVVIVLAGTPGEDEARAIARELAPDADDAPAARDATGILLPAIAAAVPDGSAVQSTILVGDPVEALLRTSQRADALFLGSRAYGSPHAVHAGGVARRVLDGARCPVVIVPRDEEVARVGD
jgi:nucleotide-binding universal stress UspA family protein